MCNSEFLDGLIHQIQGFVSLQGALGFPHCWPRMYLNAILKPNLKSDFKPKPKESSKIVNVVQYFKLKLAVFLNVFYIKLCAERVI